MPLAVRQLGASVPYLSVPFLSVPYFKVPYFRIARLVSAFIRLPISTSPSFCVLLYTHTSYHCHVIIPPYFAIPHVKLQKHMVPAIISLMSPTMCSKDKGSIRPRSQLESCFLPAIVAFPTPVVSVLKDRVCIRKPRPMAYGLWPTFSLMTSVIRKTSSSTAVMPIKMPMTPRLDLAPPSCSILPISTDT